MANPEHLAILDRGVEVWNEWRSQTEVEPDLSRADLSGRELMGIDWSHTRLLSANLRGCNLDEAELNHADIRGVDLEGGSLEDAELHKAIASGANFIDASLVGAILSEACLANAKFVRADLSEAYLGAANLFEADLSEANLCRASFMKADLTEAVLTHAAFAETSMVSADLTRAILNGTSDRKTDLTGTNLSQARLVETQLENTILQRCHVYGISAWNLDLAGTEQHSLIVTRENEAEVTVDDLEVAQFVYLMLSNQKIRDVLTTVGSKGVLILGRFTGEGRKEILDAVRAELRQRDFLPMVFDFERPTDRDFTETVKTLAGMSAFIIADITNPKSTPLELQATVPDYMIPFAPILQDGERPFAMFRDLQQKYNWVLDVFPYFDCADLIDNLMEVVQPALDKREELITAKDGGMRIRKRVRT